MSPLILRRSIATIGITATIAYKGGFFSKNATERDKELALITSEKITQQFKHIQSLDCFSLRPKSQQQSEQRITAPNLFEKFLKNTHITMIEDFSILSSKSSSITKDQLKLVVSRLKASCDKVLEKPRSFNECGNDAKSLIEKLNNQNDCKCLKKLILYAGKDLGLSLYDKQSYWIPKEGIKSFKNYLHPKHFTNSYLSPSDDSYHAIVYTEIIDSENKKLSIAIDVNFSRRVSTTSRGQLFVAENLEQLIQLINGRFGEHNIYAMQAKTSWTEIFSKRNIPSDIEPIYISNNEEVKKI